MNIDLDVLYCMCVGDLLSAGVCCLLGGPVFERSRGHRLSETVSPPKNHPIPHLHSAFPNSTTGVSCFCPPAWCKYLHLTLSAAYSVFQSLVMLGPFMWAFHNLSNSVRSQDIPLSLILLWACPWTFISSGSSSFPSLQFFQTRTIMGQSFDCGMATPPSLDALSFCWRWAL